MRVACLDRAGAVAVGAAVVVATGAAAIYLVFGRSTSGLQPVSRPSVPRSSRPVPGIGAVRDTAKSWRAAAGYGAYSYLIVGLDLAHRAAREPGRSLVYFSGTDVNRRWDAGVPYPQARRQGWLLRDRAGNLLVNRGYPENYVGDVGNPAYQHAWLDNVSRLLRRNGDDGVFIDDTIADLAPLAGTEAAKYPTAAKWAEAQLSFLRTVGEGLRTEGYYVLANASGFVRGSSASNDGSSTASWWRRLAPYVSGLSNEYFEETSNGHHTLRTYGSAWYQAWGGWERLVTTAQSLGKDFFGITSGPPGDARRMSYGKASFLLGWNGGGGAFVYQPTGAGDPWNGAWTSDIGRPVAPRRRVGVAWLRRYRGGVVLVNPDASRSQGFDLRRTYLSPDGAPVSQLTLPPTTGLVLALAPSGEHVAAPRLGESDRRASSVRRDAPSPVVRFSQYQAELGRSSCQPAQNRAPLEHSAGLLAGLHDVQPPSASPSLQCRLAERPAKVSRKRPVARVADVLVAEPPVDE